MAFQISQGLRRALSKTNIRPNLILEFIGPKKRFATARVQRALRIGDDGLEIGDDWVIGGTVDIDGLSDVITFDGTSTSIRQNLEIDKGRAGTVSSLKVTLVDDGEVSKFISPGFDISDILAQDVLLWAGAEGGTVFPEDYFVVFRGSITECDASQGAVTFTIASPDQKLRGASLTVGKSVLYEAIDAEDDEIKIPVEDSGEFLPGGHQRLYDADFDFVDGFSFTPYLKIGDEMLEYYETGIGGIAPGDPYQKLFQLKRGELFTSAASHDAGEDVEAIYLLEGHPLIIALYLMMSKQTTAAEQEADSTSPAIFLKLRPSSINYISPTEHRENCIFFKGVDLAQKYGVYGSRRFPLKVRLWDISEDGMESGPNQRKTGDIAEVIVDDFGTRLILENVEFDLSNNVPDAFSDEEEPHERAELEFYNPLATFYSGLGLTPGEVDIQAHLDIIERYLPLDQYKAKFWIRETIENTKEWIEQELYAPFGCYGIPRKGRASIAFNSPPLPVDETPILDERHVQRPADLRSKRSTSRYFYNSVIVKYHDTHDSEDFTKAIVVVNEDSRAQIKLSSKPLIIESKGYKHDIASTPDRIRSIASRILSRYKFAAQLIPNVRLTPDAGYNLEVGDTVLLDGSRLGLVDIAKGKRGAPPKLYEVVNKSTDLKTLSVTVDLLDTNFDESARYALISPSSQIRAKVSPTQFIIEAAFSKSAYGEDEYRKWESLFNPAAKLKIRVRKKDWSQDETVTLDAINGNTITVSPALSFDVERGDIMEFPDYPDATEAQKALYAFMADEPGFADGSATYKMY